MRRRGATAPIVRPAQRGAPLLNKTSRDAWEARVKAMRQKVQVAKRQLRMDDDAYRAMLSRVTAKSSSTTCNLSELDAVLKEMERLGFKAPERRGDRRRPLPKEAQIRMIHGVWNDIAPLIEDGSEAALRAFVQRQTRSRATPDGISAPEFLDSNQANRVLEGLKAWRARLGKAKERADG